MHTRRICSAVIYGFMACAFVPIGGARLSAIPTGYVQAGKTGIVEVSAAKAAENLVKRTEPVYPPLAKATRIQGAVKLQLVISKTGAVVSWKVLSGHPFLVQSAVDAVKQWQYKPFLFNGEPEQVTTELEIPFSWGIKSADYKQEQRINEAYSKRNHECRDLLKGQKHVEAEPVCKTLPDLAEKLPPGAPNERMEANGLAGRSFLFQRKPAEALKYFRVELSIAESSLKPYEAELGYAHHHVAWGYHATGNTKQAQAHYQLAEDTLMRARDHMDEEFFKVEYAKALQSVLRDYAMLLKQTGQDEAAAKAQERSAAIAKQIHPVKVP